jgi:penicillin-binding protein 1A
MKIMKSKKNKKLNLNKYRQALSEKVNTIKDKANNLKDKNKSKKKVGHKVLIVVLGLATIIVGLLLCFGIYIIVTAPDFNTDLLYNKEASVLLDKNGDEFARLGSENRELVNYDDLPQVLVDAIVATEDSRFFQHNGFDIARFMKASIGQLTGNSSAGGASTLTMQLVKNTYTDPSLTHGVKGIIRKFTDIYMAIFKVEKKYTKEEIMEFYVNQPWLGTNAWGIEQACKLYFNKSVKDLSLPEAALMAGIFNNPIYLNPFKDVEAASNRRDVVLDLMYKHGYITEEQMNDAKSISVESLIVPNTGASLNKYQSFIDAVVNEVKDDTGMNAYSTPMEIQTTLDPDIQDVLINLNNGQYYTFVNNVIQIGVAITDTTNGAVLAVDGGRNQTSQLAFNRATQMSRQPGSTAKPIFDYGPIIEYNNASPGTYFWDEPMTYSNGQSVKDADGRYQGMETMRTALSQSRNIPAIQAFQQVDKDKIASFAHSLGIDYGDNLYESCAIGGGFGVSPLQLSAAYAAFARGGYYIEPYTYTKITFKDTNEVSEQKPKKEKVMSEETAYMINSILVTAQQNNVGGNFSISGTDVAAKTGTSTYDLNTLKEYGVPDSASADNWDITYSPDYTISLWYGYDKLTHDYYTNSITAAIARKKIMTVIAKRVYKTNSRFEKPSGVISVEVEKDTVPLQLPSAYTPADMRTSELFKSGTEPSEVSNRYQQLDNPTNGKATTSGDIINLSWDGIATPAAIDQNSLQNYFNTNYGQFATEYYNKRISYNNSYIGYLGYQVYLNNNGTLTSIGYTTNNSFSYNTSGIGGNYKFVIKAAYSIFKQNASTGLEINSQATTTSNIKLSGSTSITLHISTGYYNLTDNTGFVDDNGNNITSKVNYTTTIIDTTSNTTVKQIDLSKAGSYEVTYNITNNNAKLTRTIIVTN